jgi:hypothetical protein
MQKVSLAQVTLSDIGIEEGFLVFSHCFKQPRPTGLRYRLEMPRNRDGLNCGRCGT